MPDYEMLYATMFDSVTQAIRHIEEGNIGFARDVLLRTKEIGAKVCFSDADAKGLSPASCTPGQLWAIKRRKRREKDSPPPSGT